MCVFLLGRWAGAFGVCDVTGLSRVFIDIKGVGGRWLLCFWWLIALAGVVGDAQTFYMAKYLGKHKREIRFQEV